MSAPTVAVTGITGYIGSHVAALLLSRGYTVHGTVRNNTPSRVAHLKPASPQQLRVFEADLLDEGSFDAATAGCKYVIHVASPWKLTVRDAQAELIDPAVEGTLNVLRSCARNAVSKVVLTSSDAALADGGAHGRVFDEADWNTHSSAAFLPYYYGKAEAERRAWAFAADRGLALVAINPPAVLGPSLTDAVNESAQLLVDVARRNTPGVIDLELAVVDVRDVAEAHVRAMERDDAAGRYVCCPPRPMIHVREIARLWKSLGGDPKMNELTHPVVTAFLKLCAPLWVQGKGDAQFIGNHLGTPLVLSSEKIVRELGMEFRTPEQTTLDALNDLIKWGHIEKPGGL